MTEWKPPLIEPHDVPLAEFPESTATAKGMKVIDADLAQRHGMAFLDIVYAHKSERDLHLQILSPPGFDLDPSGNKDTYPLIVYVQGSAWQEQMVGQSLPALAHFSERGYVIAIVEYRPSPVAVFPAQVLDAKTAVGFLTTHAAEFGIDPTRIVMWGDSSGGHTTLMAYVTETDPKYSDGPVDDLGIACYIDFYGPTNIALMNEQPSIQDHVSPMSPEGQLIGCHNVRDNPGLVAPTVIMNHIGAQALKPLLIMHGDKDRLVPFAQSVVLYDALVEAGQAVEFYQLKGSDHGGPAFWQEPVMDIVDAFIRQHLPTGHDPTVPE